MNIAILETGRINATIADRFDRYPDMFRTMFDAIGNADLVFTDVPVIDGVFPDSVDAYDGYLVTGSAAGVYDDFDWIDPLKAFIRDIYAARKPLVGVCFGHQVIAEALGGRCIKWPDGFGVGTCDVTLANTPDWMPDRESVRLIHFHQDQVTALPEGATHLGSTGYCANAMYYIDDHVFSMQGHPEFSADYTAALLTVRAADIGDDRVTGAIADLAQEHEGTTIARWIKAFFTSHMPSKSAA
ncbi:MAG: glutamine amidotransferase-related protein [Candidatus Puniceispirillaceae bacterium]